VGMVGNKKPLPTLQKRWKYFLDIPKLVQDRSNIQTTQLTSQQLKQLSKSSSHLKVTNKTQNL